MRILMQDVTVFFTYTSIYNSSSPLCRHTNHLKESRSHQLFEELRKDFYNMILLYSIHCLECVTKIDILLELLLECCAVLCCVLTWPLCLLG